jgi:cell division protein FtsW
MRVAVTILICCVASLLALGLVMLYSSSSAQVGARYLMLQLVWCVLAVAACIVTTMMDYRQLKKVWWWTIAGALIMLAAVLATSRINGARRWFSLAGLHFQPSEFAKIALIIALAWYAERFQRQMPTLIRGLLVPVLLIGMTLGLIVVEPDVGNTLVLAVVSGILLLVAGVRLRYFLPPVLAVAVGVGVYVYQNLAELTAVHQRGEHGAMRSERIYSWLHLEETKRGKGMQAYEAMVALGSGGLAGKGLGDGLQKLGWVPEHHTDFIFSIIGEELGLLATLLVVLAFAAILFCGICIARHSSDTFGLVLGTGITFLISLQAFINIGVVTSALPNKGLPLPFISYGGSNLLITLASVGVLLSIARHGRQSEAVADLPPQTGEFHDSNPFKASRAKPASGPSDNRSAHLASAGTEPNSNSPFRARSSSRVGTRSGLRPA